jgi:signal transduction histidine kinase
MKWKFRRSEGIKLLTLELAIVVPALALVLFSLAYLHSIQRDHAVEAAIQRQFEEMLAISEKQMAAKTYDLVDVARADFSAQDERQPMLANVLEKHSYLAHAFVFDQQHGVLFASRQSRMQEPDFAQESQKTAKMLSAWIPMEAKEIVEKFGKNQRREGHPYIFDYALTKRATQELYQPIVLFPLPGVAQSREAIGVIVFDADYIKNTYFPHVLDFMADCPQNRAPDSGGAGAAMMLYIKNMSEALATSSNFDGGKPEVQRAMDTMPGLVLGIKYRGTTIAALGNHFLKTSYLILACLTLLMGGGVFLTYRNVNREIALAKLKSDFVSNVSHELRTPLASIRLYAETLEMGRLTTPEKYRDYYRIIRKESERLTGLINNILDFSRIEAGRKEYDFKETDLTEVVHSTLDSCRYQVEQQGFIYEENLENVPPVRVDREAIARSLLNLVNNAVKYSADEKYLRVNLYRTNGVVRMEVVDHGIGVPRSEQQKIFEKFYRACDPLVHNTKGSGLGLSLVKHVVEAHRGEVEVSSSPGHGSKFTIILPVNAQAKSAQTGLAS